MAVGRANMQSLIKIALWEGHAAGHFQGKHLCDKTRMAFYNCLSYIGHILMVSLVKKVKQNKYFVQSMFKQFYSEMSKTTSLVSQKQRKWLGWPPQPMALGPLFSGLEKFELHQELIALVKMQLTQLLIFSLSMVGQAWSFSKPWFSYESLKLFYHCIISPITLRFQHVQITI